MKGGRCRCPPGTRHRCGHCKQAVTQALEALPGVSDVNVNLEKGEATWKESQPLDIAEVKKAINKLGFEA